MRSSTEGSSSGRIGRFLVHLWLIGIGSSLLAEPCAPELRLLAPARRLPVEAPQGVTFDSSGGTLWVASGLSSTVLELDGQLEVVGSLEAPFAPVGVTGIAYNQDEDTLLIVQTRRTEVWELLKDGTPTGRVVPLRLEPPVNIIPDPIPRGLAYDPRGDGGGGSIWVVESVRTTIYEVAWSGAILRSFCHPDDPDGCPGDGRAAFARDIEIVRAADGSAALDLIGGRVGSEVIRRVTPDGRPTALSIPLREIGGSPGGFARGAWRDPASGKLKEVVYISVESSAEIQVLESIEPTVLPPTHLVCEPHRDHIELSWTPSGNYDSARVLLDGEVVSELPPGATTFAHRDPRDGVLQYTIEAGAGDCTVSASCVTVFGAGQVVDRVRFEGGNPQDLTQDGERRLWITTEENQLVVYTTDLELERSLPGPFDGPDDHTTGIAYNPRGDTLFVYNTSTHLRAEIDRTGALIASPAPSGIGADGAREPILVTSMLFDPAGDGGDGSFWYVDATHARLEERGRGGSLVRSCVSPDAARGPTAGGSELAAYLWGLSTVPGHGFRLLETSSGIRRDLRATHVLRIDTETCEPTGFEIPFTGMDAIRRPAFVAYLHTTVDERATAFALNPFSSKPHLFRLETRPPSAPPVTELTCGQPSVARDVLLRFRAPATFERIEILRDGETVASLEPADGARGHLDAGVPSGFHIYEAIVHVDGLRSEARSCGVQVGPGSIARREFADPVVLPHQIAFDPSSNEYVAASRSRRHGEELHFYDADLEYTRSAPGPFFSPESIAALAVRPVVRPVKGESEIFCLGWRPGASPGRQPVLPVRVATSRGEIIREFEVMTPPAAPLVTFPSGLAWDDATDTLWLLERNSRTIINIALDGAPIGSFSHPAPLHQDGVKNHGLAVDGKRGAIYLTGAGRLDQKVTRILEVTREGRLTGVEIPVGGRFYTDIDGFTLSPDGSSFVAASRLPALTDWVSYRAFDPLAAVADLSCTIDEVDDRLVDDLPEDRIRLDWTNPVEYDRVVVFRDGVEVASLPGSAESWVDPSTADDAGAEPDHVYRVVGGRADRLAAGALCTAWSRGRPPAMFLRGDVEENGTLNITDALAILGYLFGGAASPTCPDAADVDDDGSITIGDAISLLSFLFQGDGGGRSPAPPYPIPGLDVTRDGLDCR